MEPKKQCTNPTCYLRTFKVTTEIKLCLACDTELSSAFDFENLLGSIFGDIPRV